jgi:hypothetical protein
MDNIEIDVIESPLKLEIKNNDCIFCLENCTPTENFVQYNERGIQIGEHFYKINCKCSPNVHEKCMSEWLRRENKCLICLNEITSVIEHNYDIHYSTMCKKIIELLKIIQAIIVCFIIMGIFLAYLMFI